MELELRKQLERDFHNKMRADGGALDSARSNKKFYSIVRSSRAHWEGWIQKRAGEDKKFLDYACGDGLVSMIARRQGFDVTGIDISDTSVENARQAAMQEGFNENIRFQVMDCEATEFPDNYFDTIFVGGVLHHLDLPKAFAELARILKPDGEILCGEGLADNPLLRWYRRRTPQLRTEWEAEHILRVRDIRLARRYFGRVKVRFYHLFTIAAVPFRRTKAFGPLLSCLEAVDSVVLRFPFVRNQAWQAYFTLSEPRKSGAGNRSRPEAG